nr:MAG TPA: DNA circularization protein [Caudoviricetes sp.]
MSVNIKYSARFRDAVFYFSGSATTSGGRKLITREFPGTNRRYVEDMGLLNKTLDIEAIVTTEREKNKLIAALETPGIGQLSHPTFGLLDVTAKPYTVVDSINTVGYCQFNLSFDVSQENIYPVANASNISFLQSKISFLDNSILSNFASKIGITPATLNTAINTATKVMDTIETATQAVEGVRNGIIAVKETIVDTIQSGSAFLGEVKATINSVTSFFNDPLAAFDTLTNMFDFGDSSETKPTTQRAIERKRVADTITQATNAAIVSSMYDLISQAEFENDEQLRAKSDVVESLYESLIENPTDFLIDIPETELPTDDEDVDVSELSTTSVLENLQEVRQLANDILSEKENTVARVIEVNTYNTTLDDFVFSYYGNLDYLDKIESMNDIEDRSNVSGTLKVLSK